MKKKYFIYLFLIFIALGCSSENEETPIQPRANNELEGDWVLTTRIIKYEGETFIEDLINEQCESYSTFTFQGEDELQFQTYDAENNCEQITIPQKWSYEPKNNILSVTDISTNYTIVYEIQEVTQKKLELEVLSQGGDELVGTGFEVYLIFVK